MLSVLMRSAAEDRVAPFERHVIEGTPRNVQRARQMGPAASIGQAAKWSWIG